MIPEQAWGLVPEYRPTGQPAWKAAFAARAGFTNREALAYYWATYLLEQFRSYAREQKPRLSGLIEFGVLPTDARIVDVSAGFIQVTGGDAKGPTSVEPARVIEAEGKKFAFGLVIGLDGPPTGYQPVDTLQGFPLVFQPRAIQLDAIDHPNGATSTCYAKPRSGKVFYGPVWSDGILIARHVLSSIGFNTGVAVPMINGLAYQVCDIDSVATTIDAAILDCGTVPSNAAALPLTTALAPGSAVEIVASSVISNVTVLRIHDDPKYFGNMISHRTVLDTHGVKGDSGSLVRLPGRNEAVGIYIGKTGGAPAEGLVQSMLQVVNYFDIDLYI